MAAKWLSHQLNTSKAVVVVFDMCSSTSIIEDLTQQGAVSRLEDFLREFKRHLMAETKRHQFVPYKFTGDGWILLFNDVPGSTLALFVRELCEFYRAQYKALLRPYLNKAPRLAGLTFGIARGVLTRTTMFGNDEYLGRAINVACRLQNSVKEGKGTPAYRGLVTKPVFQDYFRTSQIRRAATTRELRNIRGGKKFPCVKLFF